jgi:hypothetical protein
VTFTAAEEGEWTTAATEDTHGPEHDTRLGSGHRFGHTPFRADAFRLHQLGDVIGR